ncbi:MAG: hypothetical protein KC591_06000, partial [Gemmatimonadetes bacterium]|nr:hypothetical protein [Gemmatimonadota bacterium]
GGTWRAVAFAAGAVGYPALLWILGGVRLSDFRELRDAIRPPAAPENDAPDADDVGGPGAGA